MALEKVKTKMGMGGSRNGKDRTAKTHVVKQAGKKRFRREARKQERDL